MREPGAVRRAWGLRQILAFLKDMQAEPLIAPWATGLLRRIEADPAILQPRDGRNTLTIVRDAAAIAIARRLRNPRRSRREGRPHGLPGELIVSLTSYPPRFGSLDLTLASLLDQSTAPDRIILWLARGDEGALPDAVRALAGVTVQLCDDLRSYKKLVPALEKYPRAFVATADDDVFYGQHWLESLVSAVAIDQKLILCRRAHRLKHMPDGHIAPYADWERDVLDAAANRPSTDLVPNGVGGVLYPPGAFDPIVFDRERFTRLCPQGDDLWFYWTARMAGARHRQCGGKFWQLHWPTSQDVGLWMVNHDGGNDVMVKALEAEFGPLPL